MEAIELGKTTWDLRFARWYREGKTGLAAIGVWYLLQIFGVAPIINVAVPEEIQQDIPHAKIYRSK